jgi:biopolymer transport protein ExbD
LKPSPRYDVEFRKTGQIYRAVPFDILTDWIQQAKVKPHDRVQPAGAAGESAWQTLESTPVLAVYLPSAKPMASDATEPSENATINTEAADFLELPLRKSHEDDDDVDMIPLIDISLVLLIFFMMTTTVSSVSKIAVPEMKNAGKLDAAPDIIRIDIDWMENRAVYGVAVGTAAPAAGLGNLEDENAALAALDGMLAERTRSAKVRIAAHAQVPYEYVERIFNALELRIQQKIPISNITTQVSEKP